MVKHELRVVSYEFKALKHEVKFKRASSNLWVMSSNPRVQIHELWVQLYDFRIQIHKLQVEMDELRVQIYELRV